MKETTPAAMPPCFNKWCKRFDDLLRTKAQDKGVQKLFRGIIGRKQAKKPISNGF